MAKLKEILAPKLKKIAKTQVFGKSACVHGPPYCEKKSLSYNPVFQKKVIVGKPYYVVFEIVYEVLKTLVSNPSFRSRKILNINVVCKTFKCNFF